MFKSNDRPMTRQHSNLYSNTTEEVRSILISPGKIRLRNSFHVGYNIGIHCQIFSEKYHIIIYKNMIELFIIHISNHFKTH